MGATVCRGSSLGTKSKTRRGGASSRSGASCAAAPAIVLPPTSSGCPPCSCSSAASPSVWCGGLAPVHADHNDARGLSRERGGPVRDLLKDKRGARRRGIGPCEDEQIAGLRRREIAGRRHAMNAQAAQRVGEPWVGQQVDERVFRAEALGDENRVAVGEVVRSGDGVDP